MVHQINGKSFKLDLALSKYFDKYLEARGSPPEIIKLSSSTDTLLTWEVSGDQYTITVTMPSVDHQFKQTFQIGHEVQQTARDGLVVKSKWTREGNKLTETQTAGDKIFIITHDYSNAGIAHLTYEAGNVTATQVYTAV